MTYIDGFVIAVPPANKQKFIEHARQPAHGPGRAGQPADALDGKRMIFCGFEPVVEVKA